MTAYNVFFISFILCLLFFTINICSAANILMLSTVPSVSHSLWNQKLAEILADRNHRVTILDTGSSVRNHTNIRHIEMFLPFDVDSLDLKYFSQQSSPKHSLDTVFEWVDNSCRELLKLPQTKLFFEENRKKKKPFDLIILDGACCESFLGFVEAFGSPPLVIATAYGSSSYLMDFAGLYDNPSYVPYSSSPFISDMNFMERLENTFIYLYYYYAYHIRVLASQNEMARQFFGDNISDVRDLSRDALITLINYHPVFDGVKPFLVSTVPIGGFHIDKPKPLDKELQTFLDNSKNGAIYISFGTNLQCEHMTEDRFQIFLQTFREIKLSVVWKCGKQIENLPNNIYLGKWFKQNDVLAHPNVKVFISHGGLLGTQEAIYNGVPVLALPFIVDQHFVAQRLQRMGVAITLTYADITVNSVKQALNKLLTDKSYKEKMNEMSAAFRDNPISPKELTIYWIEYALRHPRTELLRSQTQKMSIYQILLLDVIVFIAVVILIVILAIFFLIKMLFPKTKNEVKQKKT